MTSTGENGSSTTTAGGNGNGNGGGALHTVAGGGLLAALTDTTAFRVGSGSSLPPIRRQVRFPYSQSVSY